ncbi:MAG TPA: sucrose phosphorylase [Steroidobacteraceae bacterium]|nr:sucrose phosphorylase [Steroidobacteraceae bacterium]
MKNKVQLIAYADRLGGDGLAGLAQQLRGPLRGLFGGVHILPFFYPIDGADAGFDPIDHTRVDPRLGGWEDIEALTRELDVMADVIVNHISADSAQFRDYLKHDEASRYSGLFLTRDKVFPDGATDADLKKIYRPRPGLPFTSMQFANGRRRELWTTFSPNQIDIDVRHPQGVAYLERILDVFGENGIRMVRLDAAGYAIKKAGGSCFMMPETFEFITAFGARARARDIECLVEVHAHHRQQIDIGAHVDWVYDFALPPLILHAFSFHTAANLKEWIRIRPTNALTVLDTHDGIGIIDIGPDRSDPDRRPGLVPAGDLDRLVGEIHRNCHDQSRQATGTAASNLDLYQVNCTFYDAMGRDPQRYLAARAAQFFLPGIPQVYYVGLLAGTNDMELLARTGVGRDINRHYYPVEEIEAALRQPVVMRLLDLIRLRNSHPAFDGDFTLAESANDVLDVKWVNGAEVARLRIDFGSPACELTYTERGRLRGFGFGDATAASVARSE